MDLLYMDKDVMTNFKWSQTRVATLREESSQTNFILQYKLLAAISSAVCSVIQQT